MRTLCISQSNQRVEFALSVGAAYNRLTATRSMVNTRGSATAAANAATTTNPAPSASQASSSSRQQATATSPAAQATIDPNALDPALAAQITGVGPALAAIAAAIGATGPASQPAQQPEKEPNGSPSDDDEPMTGATVASKRAVKVDLRHIKVARFDGTVPAGSFDAKAREFCEELDEHMDISQNLTGQLWDDEVKKAVFKMQLTSMERRWYRDWCVANSMASYSDGADALVHEFRPVLLGVDIAERIKRERKRWNETYREFADRLTQMADALEGGKAVPSNARHALVAFERNAYPKYTDFLETKVSLDADSPEEQLRIAISVLARKAESNGRLPERVKTKTPPAAPAAKTKQQKPAVPQKKQQHGSKKPADPKKRPAEAPRRLRGRRSQRRPATPTPERQRAAPSSVSSVVATATPQTSVAGTWTATRTVSSAGARPPTPKRTRPMTTRTKKTTNEVQASGGAQSSWTRVRLTT